MWIYLFQTLLMMSTSESELLKITLKQRKKNIVLIRYSHSYRLM
jgi:hypothetical protein